VRFFSDFSVERRGFQIEFEELAVVSPTPAPVITTNCTGNLIQFDLNSGEYPEELSWELRLEDSVASIYEFSPGDSAISGQRFTYTACLVDGNYEIVMKDTFGDGWNSGSLAILDFATKVTIGFGRLAAGSLRVMKFTLPATAIPTCASGDTVAMATLLCYDWAEEISWTVQLGNGTMVAEQPATYLFEDRGTFVFRICLPTGTYTLGCLDTYRDGWHGGNLTLVDEAGNVLVTCAPLDGANNGEEFLTFGTPYDPSNLAVAAPTAAAPTAVPGASTCANYTVLDAATFGSISDGSSSTENYRNDVSCGWLIQHAADTPIELTIQRLRLERGYDSLNVFDGPDTSSNLLVTFTGISEEIENPIVRSSGGKMFVEFASDSSVTDLGFEASYGVAPGNPPPPPPPPPPQRPCLPRVGDPGGAGAEDSILGGGDRVRAEGGGGGGAGDAGGRAGTQPGHHALVHVPREWRLPGRDERQLWRRMGGRRSHHPRPPYRRHSRERDLHYWVL
jgi:hypothetical protein